MSVVDVWADEQHKQEVKYESSVGENNSKNLLKKIAGLSFEIMYVGCKFLEECLNCSRMGSNEGRVETERLKNSKLFKKNLKCLWQRRWSILNVGGDPYKKEESLSDFPKSIF